MKRIASRDASSGNTVTGSGRSEPSASAARIASSIGRSRLSIGLRLGAEIVGVIANVRPDLSDCLGRPDIALAELEEAAASRQRAHARRE